MHLTRALRVLSSFGGIGLIGVSGYVNIQHTPDHDMQVVVGALAAGTALAAWLFCPMWNGGRRLLAGLALFGILAGELYGFVATSERLLGARNASQSLTATSNQTWVQRNAALEFAVSAAKTECATGRKTGCKEAEKKVDEARAILAGTQVPVSVNSIADLMGWAPIIVDMIPVLAGSVALNLLGFVMLGVGHPGRKAAEADLDIGVCRAPQFDPVVIALKKAGRPVTNGELAALLDVSPGQASKMVSARADRIRKEKVGKEVAITLH